MKKLLLLLFATVSLTTFARKDTIRSVLTPVPSYDPNGITIPYGDTIVFLLTSEHNAREVSEQTWNENDDVALEGGFEVPFGGGEVVPDLGIHYFVCVTHVDMGMKGTVNVSLAAVGVYTGPEPVLYPNPADKVIRVDMRTPVSVQYTLIDQKGDLVMKSKSDGLIESLEIPVNDLPQGVYLLTLYGGVGEYRCRIVLR